MGSYFFKISLCLTVSVFSLTSHLKAALIDFEGITEFRWFEGEYVDIDGFRFQLIRSSGPGVEMDGDQGIAVHKVVRVPGGTKLVGASFSVIEMTKLDHGKFDLFSLDVGGSIRHLPERWASSVDIIGGGKTVNVPLPGDDREDHFTVANMLDVSSVVFSPHVNVNDGPWNWEYAIDNLLIGPIIPEPSNIVTWSLGIFGMMMTVRNIKN